VVGVNLADSFLNQKDAEGLKQRIAQRNELDPGLSGEALDQFSATKYVESGYSHPKAGHATVEDAAECIDHIVKVTSIDHVGIGSDFDGVPGLPQGLEDVSKMPALTAALLRRGYTQADIRKIMGENFLRVMREVVGN
jgi:membrane dipeptidase